MRSNFIFITDKAETHYDVILGGETKLKGQWVNSIASIAYNLEDNVFIVASPGGRYLKMVKIHVTGVSTFDWIEARLHQDVGNYPKKCKIQATFSEDCFKGTSIGETYYNVSLVAKPREKKRKKRALRTVSWLKIHSI